MSAHDDTAEAAALVVDTTKSKRVGKHRKLVFTDTAHR